MTVISILGTRPQIIKSAPVFQEAVKQGVDIKIIHTGQHYDYALSQRLFEELSPPQPFINLGVGSGSHIFQIAEIMKRIEKYLVEEKPKLVLIPGDTNSALAGALASVKLGIPVAHLEAGARSYDMNMAEEINRRLIDHCSKLLFAPTENCMKNLADEKVRGSIFQTGDTMYDVFLAFKKKAENCDILERLGLSKEYSVMTLHRAENVDDQAKLKGLFQALASSQLLIVFPIHPRTKERLKASGISLPRNIRTIDPVSYVEMLALLKHAKAAITDSGGLQKEAFWSETPCITVRDRTEWTETVDVGVNFVTDVEPARISQALGSILDNYKVIKSKFQCNPYGDGRASEKVVKILAEAL